MDVSLESPIGGLCLCSASVMENFNQGTENSGQVSDGFVRSCRSLFTIQSTVAWHG